MIAILGLLIGLVALAALCQMSGARNSIADQSIERIGALLARYKVDGGIIPPTGKGLSTLVRKRIGTANWNRPYLKADADPVGP